jgi:hypothetical protein
MFKLYNIVSGKLPASQIQVCFARTRYHGRKALSKTMAADYQCGCISQNAPGIPGKSRY